MSQLEKYFSKFRQNIIGIDQEFNSYHGRKKIIYADWVASGRLYKPIEAKIISTFGPFVGNTHTETSITGTSMTRAYHYAHSLIKKHVNADENDRIITPGFGMTAAVLKFQRILGLKVCEQLDKYLNLPAEEKPVVFLTHMEHHSNHTSWYETIADVVVIEPDETGLVNYERLEQMLKKYSGRKLKIGSFSACSNVTGIQPDIKRLARIMHENGGICFADYAASAPYVSIDMHPNDPLEKLDAIFFSPHKFLGGPQSSGALVFDSKLYNRRAPDQPGGGTVDWTNPWGEYKYLDDIELREDGGTPGFLQAIRTALSIKLKEEMNTEKMMQREEELLQKAFYSLGEIPSVHILAGEHTNRLGIISFYLEDVHFNLTVKLLNDRYGIQVRGGCSCAGTYGHYLLHVDPTRSKRITDKINQGDLSEKPGWVRLSLHPTMTDAELDIILKALAEITENYRQWQTDYKYDPRTNEFYHTSDTSESFKFVEDWFE